MAGDVWSTFSVTNRMRSFCTENPTNCGNAAIIAMLLREFHIRVSNNQVAGVVSRMGLERGGYRKPTVRGPEEIAWTNPRLPEMLTQHGRGRENGRLGALARHKGTAPLVWATPAPRPLSPLVARLKTIIEAPRKANPGVKAAMIANGSKGRVSDFDNVTYRPIVKEEPRVSVPGGHTCLFPLWKDGAKPDHKYCDAPVTWRVRDGERVLSSYCARCHAICHTRSYAA